MCVECRADVRPMELIFHSDGMKLVIYAHASYEVGGDGGRWNGSAVSDVVYTSLRTIFEGWISPGGVSTGYLGPCF